MPWWCTKHKKHSIDEECPDCFRVECLKIQRENKMMEAARLASTGRGKHTQTLDEVVHELKKIEDELKTLGWTQY